MTNSSAHLEEAFIEGQRKRLTRLRDELMAATDATKAEDIAIQSDASGVASEYEDDAQRLAALEVDGEVTARNTQRLVLISRALDKIKEGTYGFSEASGDPIPRQRLEAMPEAIFTIAEQQKRDSNLG